MPQHHKTRLVNYLLGEMSDDDAGRIEQEYFADESLWQEMRTVEEELIESYVRDSLSAEERSRFETHFLASPAKRRQVAVIQMLIDPALRKEFDEEPKDLKSLPAVPSSGRSISWMPAFGLAASLVLAVGLMFLAFKYHQLNSQLNQANVTRQEQQRQIDLLRQQVAALAVRPLEGNLPLEVSAQVTISLLLEPGLQQRGGGEQINILPLTSIPTEVMLAFDLRKDQASSYQIDIQTPEGKNIHRAAGLKSRPSSLGGRVVIAKLPSQLLPRGDYLATLFSIDSHGRSEALDSYSFSVVKPL